MGILDVLKWVDPGIFGSVGAGKELIEGGSMADAVSQYPGGEQIAPLFGASKEDEAKVASLEQAKQIYEALLPLMQQGKLQQMESFGQMFGPLNQYMQQMGSSPIPMPTGGPWGGNVITMDNLRQGTPLAPPQGVPGMAPAGGAPPQPAAAAPPPAPPQGVPPSMPPPLPPSAVMGR